MRGERTYIARHLASARLVALMIAVAAPALGQISITSVQSSVLNGTPRNIQAITVGSQLPSQEFVLYLNGSFTLGLPTTIEWIDVAGSRDLFFDPSALTPNQIQVQIPQDLYTVVTSGVRTVQVIVRQGNFSATGQFFVNPPMSFPTSPLPLGTTGVAYSTPIILGGTGPYTVGPVTGSVPGLTIGAGPQIDQIAGTPTTAGVFSFSPTVTDQWGNVLSVPSASLVLQVVAPASITSVSPNAVPAGSGFVAISVTGTNFVDPESPAGGSTVLFTVNNQPNSLATTFVNTNQLQANIPTALMSTPGVAAISVLQPNDTTSPSAPFTLGAPTIATVTPSPVVAGAPAFLLTLNGANFASRVGAPDVATGPFQPQVQIATSTLQGTIVNAGVVTVTVPSNLIAAAGSLPVRVINPGGSTSNQVNLVVNPPLAITTTSLTTGTAGAPYTFHLTGTGGVGAYQWTLTGLPGNLTVNPQTGDITGTPQTAGTFSITILLVASQSQATVTLPLVIAPPNLQITTGAIPGGGVGTTYSFHMTAIGGVPPYQWSATGLPSGVGINPATGDISGTPQTAGTFSANIRVTDSNQAQAARTYSITITPATPVISTPSNLPNGTVGISYGANLDVSGGSGFTYALTSGRLPDGLNLSNSGGITGVPTRDGTFAFVVTATDTLGNTPSKGFTILILPSPLTLSDPSATLNVGTPATIGLSATGGVTPYRFAVSCSLPPGLSLVFNNISGTPTTPGTTSCRVTVTDSVGTSTSKDFTITVLPQAITFDGGTLPAGQVGVVYSATVAARGGTAPITYTGSGLPDGLSLASSGAITGTPTTAGQSSISVTATDANRTTKTAAFSITIAPAGLTITTTSLPSGVVGTAYSASLAASGGATPYTWTVSGLPSGVTATATGAISGTPDTAGSFTVAVTVTDANRATARASFTATIATPPLVISTASLPNGTVGTAYSASLAATGGAPPYTFSGTGLPAGLSLSSAGVLSGTPSAPGSFNAAVSVRDSAGTTGGKSLAITIALPPTPPLTFSGVTGTSNPLLQPRLTVSLGTPYPVDVTVTLVLTFTPDSGTDDPTIQFSTGGRTTRITIPAGSTNGATDVGIQTGTVAGVITITSQLQAAGVDVTPSPVPRQTVRINPGAPVLTQVTGVRTSTGFTITVTGYVTTREMTQAVFQLNAATGTSLQTTSLTVTLDSLFAGYFGSTAAAPFGGQFTLTQPFTVTGNVQGVAGVTVTLANKVGTSNALTVALN